MTLEERIKLMLEESEEKSEPTKYQAKKGKKVVDTDDSDDESKDMADDVPSVDISTKVKSKAKLAVDGQVSEQVSALLDAEGLSEDFKLQAVTIFEAAVSDRVLQLTEDLEAQFETKLDEEKEKIENNIDGFLNEAVAQWAKDNEVSIQSNFKTRIAESFMSGLHDLLAEHNINLPTESEDALDIALEQVNTLEEAVTAAKNETKALKAEINEVRAERIQESFKEKMTSTEFDRFVQLTESIKYVSNTQYEKQLNIVLENFGKTASKSVAPKVSYLSEEVSSPAVSTILVENESSINQYAAYMVKKAKSTYNK